jgi:hypothetical protein
LPDTKKQAGLFRPPNIRSERNAKILFHRYVAMYRLPDILTEGMLAISSNPIVILLLINICLLLLGSVMDMAALILITTPIFLPVVTAIGRLYWVAISKEPKLPQPDLVVATEVEPAQRLDDCDEMRPASCDDVAAEVEAEAEVAIVTENESAELPVNGDLDGVIATSPDDDDEYEDVELMLGEEFAKLTLADKRAYIRSIDMAARIDMRSNASMLADYEKLLAE